MGGNRSRRAVLIGSAAMFLAGAMLPARAGSGGGLIGYNVPPGCDPTSPSYGGPGACQAGAQGIVNDVQNPSTSLPDLQPDVGDVGLSFDYINYDATTQTWTFEGPHLLFDTISMNVGYVPLDLMADDATNLAGSTVSQCTSWTTYFGCRSRQQVGGFVWHDAHKHYHFNNFARYELRRVLKNGQPDMTKRGLLTVSPKVSFCMEDTRQIRTTDSPPVARYSECPPVQQGISPGYADVYPGGIEGQDLSMQGLGDGRYALVITLNTAGDLLETSTTNNRIVAIVEVSGLGTFDYTARVVNKWLM